jgi:hypothetical protein
MNYLWGAWSFIWMHSRLDEAFDVLFHAGGVVFGVALSCSGAEEPTISNFDTHDFFICLLTMNLPCSHFCSYENFYELLTAVLTRL